MGDRRPHYIIEAEKKQIAMKMKLNKLENNNSQLKAKPWVHYFKPVGKLEQLATKKPFAFLEKGEYDPDKAARGEFANQGQSDMLPDKPPFNAHFRGLRAFEKNIEFGDIGIE